MKLIALILFAGMPLSGCAIYWLPLTADPESSIPDMVKRTFMRKEKWTPVEWAKYDAAHREREILSECGCAERHALELARLQDEASDRFDRATTRDEKIYWECQHQRLSVARMENTTRRVQGILSGQCQCYGEAQRGEISAMFGGK